MSISTQTLRKTILGAVMLAVSPAIAGPLGGDAAEDLPPAVLGPIQVVANPVSTAPAEQTKDLKLRLEMLERQLAAIEKKLGLSSEAGATSEAK